MGKKPTISPRKRPRRRSGRPRRGRSVWRRYRVKIFAFIALALLVHTFLMQVYRVPSGSMEDSLLTGDRLLVDKASYGARIPFVNWRLPGWRHPRVNDIVVFRSPRNARRLYVKRCVAVGGQIVEGRDKVIYVDGRRIIDPPHSKYVDARVFPGSISPRDNFGPIRVLGNGIFVVGDNRDRSNDSRHWGPLPLRDLVGRGRMVCWSWAPRPAPPRSGEIEGAWQRMQMWLRRFRWNRVGLRIE